MEHRVTDNLSRKSGARRWQPAALLVSFFVVMVAGFGVWLTTSTSGLRWAGSTVSRLSSGQVSIEGLDGALMGPLSAQVVRLTADGRDRIVLTSGEREHGYTTLVPGSDFGFVPDPSPANTL